MAKITRKVAKLFGSSAGPTQIGQFGSLAASAPTYSSDPTVIQGLSNWLGGWFSAVIGNNSPAIEDMNAMSFVFSYQLCYLMQEGVPEWEVATVYYKGSIVNDGAGKLYVSIFDGNVGNAITNASYWLPYIAGPYTPTIQKFTSGSGTYRPTYLFLVATANATAGDTYTNNTQTFTVQKTVASGTLIEMVGTGAPLASGTLTRTSGTGDSTITFVQVKTPLYIRVQMVGGGGGGGGATTDGSPGAATVFGTSLLSSGPGLGGGNTTNIFGGTGGSPTITGLVAQGFFGADGVSGAPTSTSNGGTGGSSFFGGGGRGGIANTQSGFVGKANSGSGGGGGAGTAVPGSGGGGAGAYIDAILYSILASYSYTIGAGGAGGTGSGPGGAGADGIIIVTEFYQ